jgi:hypothetical protein
MMMWIMKNRDSEISVMAEHIYKQIYQDLSSEESASVMLAHSGRFSQDLVNSICEGVENMMLAAQVKKNLVKRMFSILIEGLQNLRIHGRADQDGHKYGHLIVVKNKDGYEVSFGSYANYEDEHFLTGHIDRLNRFTPEEVKSFYLEKLTNGFLSEKGGAGLGFITIVMKSKSQLNYSFHETKQDDLLYFTVNVKLNSEV